MGKGPRGQDNNTGTANTNTLAKYNLQLIGKLRSYKGCVTGWRQEGNSLDLANGKSCHYHCWSKDNLESGSKH
jgi:hypothetical protein